MTIKYLSVAIVLAGIAMAGHPHEAAAAPLFVVPRPHTFISPQSLVAPTEQYRAQSLTAPFDTVVADAAPAVVEVKGYRSAPAAPSYSPYGMMMAHRGIILRSAQLSASGGQTLALSGTGFFVTSNGYLVTNRHVVADPSMTYTVDTGTEELPAQVVYTDLANDIAILKVAGSGYPHLSLGDSSRVALGDGVVHIGNALGRYIDSASSGEVAALDQSIYAGDSATPARRSYRSAAPSSGEQLTGLMEITAPVYSGDSGGPVLDASGDVVAVTVAASAGSQHGFAIPVNIVKAILALRGVAAN